MGPAWHMIGHVQANKVKYIPRLFDCVHSVDTWEMLEELRTGTAIAFTYSSK